MRLVAVVSMRVRTRGGAYVSGRSGGRVRAAALHRLRGVLDAAVVRPIEEDEKELFEACCVSLSKVSPDICSQQKLLCTKTLCQKGHVGGPENIEDWTWTFWQGLKFTVRVLRENFTTN